MRTRGGAAAGVASAVAVAAACLATPPGGKSSPNPCPAPPPAGPAASAAATELVMRNVRFRFNDCIAVDVRSLRGRMGTTRPDGIVVIDDPPSLAIDVADAEVALSAADLERLLNDHVFAYPGAPLDSLHVRLTADRLVIEGRVRLKRWADFSLGAVPVPEPDGRLRIRNASISVEGVRVPRVLRSAIGFTLESQLDLRRARGLSARGDDLLLDVASAFPPPVIHAHVAAATLDGAPPARRLVVHLRAAAPAATPAPGREGPAGSTRYLAFAGGRVRFGRLLMEPADLTIVPSDSGPLFDFSLPHYGRQLVAGWSQTRADSSLVVHMPQFASLPPRE